MKNFYLKNPMVRQDGFISCLFSLGFLRVVPFLTNTPVQFSLRESFDCMRPCFNFIFVTKI